MFQTCNTLKILEIFLKEPSREVHLRELARMFDWGPGRIQRGIARFVKDGVILKKKKKIYSEYKANRDSGEYKKFKRIYNLLSLTELIKYLNKQLAFPDAILLFGSYSKGEDVETSDIDLCVLTKEKKINLEKFEKKLNRKINILFLDGKKFELAKKKNPELLNNLINGIVLSGYFKVFK